jgi:hypothetical protein
MNSQFMAWERSFEARIMKVRAKELKYQRLSYIIAVRLPFGLLHTRDCSRRPSPCWQDSGTRMVFSNGN